MGPEFCGSQLAGVFALTGRDQQSGCWWGLSLSSFHQVGYSLGFLSEGPGVSDAAWAKEMKRERDVSGLCLRAVGASTLVYEGDRGQGRDAVNQPWVSPFQVKKCKRKLFGFPRSFNKGA